MNIRLNGHRLFLIIVLGILLIPLAAASSVQVTSKEIKESAAVKAGQCVVDAGVTDSQEPQVPACPGGEVTGGGVGFKIYWNVKWGGDHWIRRGFNTCKLPLEPWKTDLAKAPYTDLLMKFYTQDEIAKITGYSADPDKLSTAYEKEKDLSNPCPGGYDPLGMFIKKKRYGERDQADIDFLGGPGVLCGKRGTFPDLNGAAAGALAEITGHAVGKGDPFPTDLTLPLVQDFKLLGCVDCDAAPACPEGYVDRGSYSGSGEVRSQRMGVGYRFCVQYNVACAAREPDQSKEMCESTDANTGVIPGYPLRDGGAGFAVDGGAGVWVKTTKTLTPPVDGTSLPTLPPEVIIDGMADPYFTRLLKPDGTLQPAATALGADAVLAQKGNCCLDGDECEPICTRNDPAGKWLEGAEPFTDGVKLFEDPKFGQCSGAGLGAELGGGEGTCGKIMNGPCCGDDDKGNAWYFDSGGDCTDTQDGAKQLCVSTAQDGEHAWKSATDAAAQGEEEVFRPLCQAGEMDIKEGKWHWIMSVWEGCNGHRVSNCGFKSNEERNPGHEPQIAGMWGGDEKKRGSPCVDGNELHAFPRVSFCGETDNDEADGGINFAVDELARFWCGFTYCRSTNTFGKDLDGEYLNDCESFPAIKVKEGIPTPWGATSVTKNNLVNTGTHCCGEVDDDDPSTPFDGEFYNDAGGRGACFINYQPNGAFLNHNVKIANIENMKYNLGAEKTGQIATIQGALYIADARQEGPNTIIGDTSTHEDKSVFVYNGTLMGCNLLGGYNSENDYLIDIKDNPNWAKGKKFKDAEVPIHDPTEGTAQNDTPANLAGEAKKTKKMELPKENVIHEQAYCSKTGPPEDLNALYCSYTEQWLERNDTERDVLKSIVWDPKETVVSDQVVPANGPEVPAASTKPYFLTRNQTNETTNSSEVVSQILFTEQECCGNTQCWDGYQCIDDQSNKPGEAPDANTALKNGQAYRCVRGQWKSAFLKYTPDDSESGYCPQDSQCLYDLEGNESQNGCTTEDCAPQCILDSQYIQDDYCSNGSWTTRTRILAQVMLDKTQVETDALDYTLFCDEASIALNNIQNPGNTNNYCVLTFDDHVVFGTSYNGNRSALFDALKQSTLFSFDNLDGNSSEVQNFGQSCTANDNFNECITLNDRDGKELLHAYHQGGLQMMVMSAKLIPGFDVNNPFTILWDWLKDLFKTILQTNNEPFELSDFKRLYLSSLTPQRIQGITETLFSQNRSTNETKVFDQLITIEYTGYGVDFNTLLNGVNAERKQVNGTNESQTVFLLNPSQDVWQQFTEKLRPKRATAPE